ncbi:hypothetical protein [Isoptericola sp. NPDC055881]
MTRTRTQAMGLATLLAAVGLVVPVTGGAAAAATATTSAVARTTDAPAAAAVEHDTDGTPLVRLTGSGTPSDGVLVGGSLLGEVVVVPGDADRATLRVRNEGPTGGTLTASIVNAAAFRDHGDDSWVDDSFYDDLLVNGVPASRLEGRQTVIHEAHLPRGESVDLSVSYDFPVEATSGNHAFVGQRVFSFDVLLRIAGDTPDDDATPGPGDPGDDTGRDDTGRDDTARDGTTVGDRAVEGTAVGGPDARGTTGLVAHTGGAADSGEPPWLLLVGAALVLVAAGALRALRGRSPSSPSSPSNPGGRE